MRGLRGALTAAATILAASCTGGGEGDAAASAQAEEAPAGQAPAGDGYKTIACALGGNQAGWGECLVERVRQGETLFLVVRHPDGGFRRFEVLKDGRGLAQADGADQGKVEISPGTIEIAVGGDRYRFPATIKASGETTGDAPGE